MTIEWEISVVEFTYGRMTVVLGMVIHGSGFDTRESTRNRLGHRSRGHLHGVEGGFPKYGWVGTWLVDPHDEKTRNSDQRQEMRPYV